MKILVTGSEGLIGWALKTLLLLRGHTVLGFDIRALNPKERKDIRNINDVLQACKGVDGIVHLAGISRVIYGEQNPELCLATNIGGVKNIVKSALQQDCRPWILFSSSREVYGEVPELPAKDTTPLRPINVYGESKARCEDILLESRDKGLVTGIVRFSNVYGSVRDFEDRVIPAFCRAAVFGWNIRVEGKENTFDFTHLHDTLRGTIFMIDCLAKREIIPPLHLLTGKPTTLNQLAMLIKNLVATNCEIVEKQSRNFDVQKFFGEPAFAKKYLNWEPNVSLKLGLSTLINEFKRVKKNAEKIF